MTVGICIFSGFLSEYFGEGHVPIALELKVDDEERALMLPLSPSSLPTSRGCLRLLGLAPLFNHLNIL